MLKNLKKTNRKHLPTYLLFTKWDRFSRNTSDAYQMIAHLNLLQIEPQAVEQPIDLSVPENKMMLAFYLAVPEVENDRRGLNIFYGIRRARKEGRWMGHAPVGYQNMTSENGRKYIHPNLVQASLMKQAFEELSTGRFSVEQVWKKAKSGGLKSQSNNFHTAIRNPLYCGKIMVPAFQQEPMQIVQGQHQSIISEELFLRVQQVIKGKKPHQKTKLSDLEQFPLRGFLKCNRCERMLTASASKGRNDYYYYYHCSTACRVRYKAPIVNQQFIIQLQSFEAPRGFKMLFKEIARDLFRMKNHGATVHRNQMIKKRDALNERILKIREMLIEEKLEAGDYQALKKETDNHIRELGIRLDKLADPKASITKLLHKHSPRFLNLAHLYDYASAPDKRKLYTAIYSGNLVYDGSDLKVSGVFPVMRLLFGDTTIQEESRP